MMRLALVCAMVMSAGCASPKPPEQGPNFEGVVRDVAVGRDGGLHVLVETLPAPQPRASGARPQTLPTQADVLVTVDANSLAQQAGGGYGIEYPTAKWIGRMVRVWFTRAGSAAAGERFEAVASAIVVEAPRSGVGP